MNYTAIYGGFGYYPRPETPFAAILECLATGKAGPTEVGRHAGYTSRKGASMALLAMEKRGWVKRVGKGKWELAQPEKDALIFGEGLAPIDLAGGDLSLT